MTPLSNCSSYDQTTKIKNENKLSKLSQDGPCFSTDYSVHSSLLNGGNHCARLVKLISIVLIMHVMDDNNEGLRSTVTVIKPVLVGIVLSID